MNDVSSYPYNSRRNVVFSNKGMVASSQPLASQAGLEMIKKGGNAVDAAIACAACLTVTEPCSNGIGGDAFSIVWNEGKLYGLNSSGPAPKRISADILKNKGYDEMPLLGWPAVTVPGAPYAWAQLSERFGKLPFLELLKPAITYARYGYPVSPDISLQWENAYKFYSKQKEEEYKYWFDTFAPLDRAPKAGELWSSKEMADTLEVIAGSFASEFYNGSLAEKIDAFSKKYGGYLRCDDLAGFTPDWVEPISINYKGYDIWEIPPNGQGIVALMALGILNGFDFDKKESVHTYHTQIEALKLAFADGKQYITDPAYMDIQVKDMLSEEYLAKRRGSIGDKACEPYPGSPDKGGTVYLATADNSGMMVSYIQSNYNGFGSGLVVPETGISLQNRGSAFSLDENHTNYLLPGKKTYHTIIPGFITKNNKAVGPFGVMGGFMQPQGHLQVVMNMVDFALNPQAALDAPRWQWTNSMRVLVEDEIEHDIINALRDKGHEIEVRKKSSSFGRGQIIIRDEHGVLCGGTEPRADSNIAAF